MIITTPPLSIKTVSVFAALFKAQLPDTLSAVRAALYEWMAAHVIVEQIGQLRRGATKEQIRDEILANIKPEGMLFVPLYRMTTPEIPATAVATFVPDQLKPKLAPEYQGWTYVNYPQARVSLVKILEEAIGGEPEGHVGIANALSGEFKGAPVLEGWGGSMAAAQIKRTVEGAMEGTETVGFWDTAWGYETPREEFLGQIDRILHQVDAKDDRLYYDKTNYSWFVVFHPGGRMRVGMIG